MPQSNRPDDDRLVPVRRAVSATLVYLLVGFAWILLSDRLVEAWFDDPGTLSQVQTWKGFFFVGVTGLVLFAGLLRQLYKDRILLAFQQGQSQALRLRERQLTVLMDNLPGMAYRRRLEDHWPLLFVSDGCAALTGYESSELINSPVIGYSDLMDAESRDKVTRAVREALVSDQPFSVEYALTRKDKRQVWVWEQGRGVVESNGETILEGVVLDISDRKELESELAEMATRDPLTGLLNRRELSRLLEEELERAKRYQRPLAILWIDFDHFKDINDTYGHAAGDSVLKSASKLLQDRVRSVDWVGRFGGEEFVIVLPEMDVAEAKETAERLRYLISTVPQPLGNGDSVPLTVSVGVAVYPSHGLTAAQLRAAADRAMYRAKDRGRNCVSMAHLSPPVHNDA